MSRSKNNLFEVFAEKITCWAGSSTAFIIAILLILAWAMAGPFFNFSETWQLIINTGTTIITFLMVFLIQKSQNKDSKAIQLKLNELIAANKYTSNRMVDIEGLSDEELNKLRQFYAKLSEEAEEDEDIHNSHSIDEAEQLQEAKFKLRKKINLNAKNSESQNVSKP
jgi:low affinity Fe/Cu permease